MRSVSAKFLNAVRSSHDVTTSVDVLYSGAVVLEDVAVEGGDVTLDRTAASLGALNLTIAEPTRLPTGPASPFSPFGYELFVRRGIAYADGTAPELVPLGVYPIQRSHVDGITLLTQITALDRSQLVRDAGFENDYTIAPGTNYGTAIQTLLAFLVPGLVFAFTSTTYTTPLLTFTPDMDPWNEAQKMARAIGCELYFDGLGRCVLRAEPDPANLSPVFTVAEGAGGVLTSAALELDRGPAFNKVIAYGTNADLGFVPRGVAVDADPTSPTYYYGGFGRKPRRYASPFLTTDEQCAAAARAILASNLGVARSIDFGLVPNPALEAGDAILVTHEALGVDTVHIADVLRLGLSADSGMTGSTRAQQDLAA